MAESKQCEYKVVNVGKGMYVTRHRCKNTALKGSKYCYQHRGGGAGYRR
jgi:hypothetical protein